MQDFVLLDEYLESVLLKLQKETDDFVWKHFSISDKEYDMDAIEKLNSYDYVTLKKASDLSSQIYLISLTYTGKNYFRLKKIYKKEIKRSKRAERIKYAINTAISLAALAVAIISLIKS